MTPSRGSRHAAFERFMELRPVVRFSIVGVLALVFWLFLEDYCWAPAREWAQQCAQIEKDMAQCESLRGPLGSVLETSVTAYGPVEIVGDIPTTKEGLSGSVDQVMRNRGVAKFGYEEIAGGKMASGSLEKSVGKGRVERCRGKFQFETTPEDLTRITHELEQADHIDAIQSINIRRNRDNKRKVTIDMTVEGWANGGGAR